MVRKLNFKIFIMLCLVSFLLVACNKDNNDVEEIYINETHIIMDNTKINSTV